jgi:hypothetical protein
MENSMGKTGTVSLSAEDAVKQILVSTLFGFWDIVNNLSRLRPYASAKGSMMTGQLSRFGTSWRRNIDVLDRDGSTHGRQ